MNAIETHNLTRIFGERVAVDNLSLAIPGGTVFGFLGPNGAGKTTTVRMLAALIAPTDGDAIVARHTLGDEEPGLRGPGAPPPSAARTLRAALRSTTPRFRRGPLRPRPGGSRCAGRAISSPSRAL